MSNKGLVQRRLITSFTVLNWLAFVALEFVGVITGQAWFITLGIIFLFASFVFMGIKVVPMPERWLVERFGKLRRILQPGLRWTFPFLDTVRAKPRVWEQPISIFMKEEEGKKLVLDFQDGSVSIFNPVVYVRLKEDKLEKTIYGLKDWVDWIRDNVEPILLRYLRTLRISEALDEGMASGDLFDRVEEAPTIIKNKLRIIMREIAKLRRIIKQNPSKEKLLEPLLDEYNSAKKRLKSLQPVYEETAKKLKELRDDKAPEFGIDLTKAFIGDFILPKSIKEAREAPLRAKREAEAAYYQAVQKAVLRAEPVIQTKTKFMETGMSMGEAMSEALKLEKLETLAKEKAWTAGLASVIKELAPLIVETVAALGTKKKQE